jgi:hypothetical protein
MSPRPVRMNVSQATDLCFFAKAACPQQAIDQDTPRAWFVLLSDLTYEDCMEALVAHVRESPFVSPAEIRQGVKKLRARRMEAFGPIPDPPAEVAADPSLFHPWLAQAKQRIADGEVTKPEQLGVLPGTPGERPALTRKQVEDATPAPLEQEDDDETA